MTDIILAKVGRAKALLAECRDATAAKKIADMAHAAEIYAKRQKASEETIAYAHGVKIDAMTLLGAFLKAQPKNRGAEGNPRGRGNKNVRSRKGTTQLPTLAESGISKKESALSQRLATLSLEEPEKHEAIRQGQVAVTSVFSSALVSKNSGNNEWYTPKEYIVAARSTLGKIDLDPASTAKANEVVEAASFYGINDDSLNKTWRGNIWLNPPYEGKLIGLFVAKLESEFQAQQVLSAIVLVNNATETKWFQRLLALSSAVCFPCSRIRFWSPTKLKASPLQGQAVLLLSKHTKTQERFVRDFKEFGAVCHVV